MHTLYLKSSVINEIRSGKRSSLCDASLRSRYSVNDEIAILEDAQAGTTQRNEFEFITIDTILEKRLKDIDYIDLGVSSSDDIEHSLARYCQNYQTSMSAESTIKVINFSFSSKLNQAHTSLSDEDKTTIITDVDVYADGGSRGNPGPSATGFVVLDKSGNVLSSSGSYIGITTNNQAEYQALKSALELANKMGARNVSVYLDSALVVNQMKGIFKVKNRDLWPIHDAIKRLCGSFHEVSFTHVPRELNKLADAQVNKILDAHAQALINTQETDV